MDNSSNVSGPKTNSLDPQQLTQQIASSYVDDYMPPVNQPAPAAMPAAPTMTPTPAPSVMPTEPPMASIPDAGSVPGMSQGLPTISPTMPTASPLMTEEPTQPPMVETVLPPEPEQNWPKEEPKSTVAEPEKKMDMPPQTLVPNQSTPEKKDEVKNENEADLASTPDAAPMPDKPAKAWEPSKLADSASPAAPASTETQATPKIEDKEDKDPETSEALEDQNIFVMLGIDKATDKEKEMFLDELQQIIWEDFLDNDVELLLTEEEQTEFKKIGDKADVSEEDRQTEMVDFLEKLVPDLEKIMMEKALDLKEEMFGERMKQMIEELAEKPEALAQIDKAKQQQKDEQWRTAAATLNAIAH